LGTLIAAYFQYLTAYEDKVATQAKEDLTAATVAFTDTSTALSVPIMLQATLFRDFVNAKGGGDGHLFRATAIADRRLQRLANLANSFVDFPRPSSQ
jgi:hypothetical protein